MSRDRLVVSLPDDGLLTAITSFLEEIEIVRNWALDRPAPRSDIDLVVLPTGHDLAVFRWLPALQARLIQSQSNGYEGVDGNIPPGLAYANAASVHEAATAELAVTLTLAAQRGVPEFVRSAMLGKWEPLLRPTLADRTVLLIGYGGVGQAIEERIIPFGAQVIRAAHSARIDERGLIYGFPETLRLLPEVDIVILAMPLTVHTRYLVNEDFLARMRDGALLVNVGRGATVDTDALLRHTANGRLRAALDVVDPEPLPDGHPLFSLHNVLISPHVGGGSTTAALPRMGRLLRAQIERMLRGEPPLNVVVRG